MSLFDGTNAPIIRVYLDTGNRSSGNFTLGWSQLGGTDVLATYTPFTTLTQFPTTDVKSISIRRGRTREDQAIQPGTLTLVMDNISGSYDPTFSKSSIVTAATGSAGVVTYTSSNTLKVGDIVTVTGLSVGALNLSLQTVTSVTSTQFTVANSATGTCSGQSGTYYSGYVTSSNINMLTAGTGIRVTAYLPSYSAEVPIYSGYIEQVDKDLNLAPVVTFTCVDLLSFLGRQQVVTNVNRLSDVPAVAKILSDSGWTGSLGGDSTVNYTLGPVPTGDAISMINTIANNQLAMFYADTSGNATWYGAQYFTSSAQSSALTATDDRSVANSIEYDEIAVIGGEKYMVNTVNAAVSYTNGTTDNITKFNNTSVGRFGTFSQDQTVYVQQSQASTMVQALADHFALPKDRVDHISFDGFGFTQLLWLIIVDLDLGSRLTVKRTPIYGNELTYDCYIQQLTHDITPTTWRMSMTLSPSN